MLTKFGKMLRKMRIDRDELLRDMADKLNVTVAYLSAVENGNREVPDTWIEIIANEYNLANEEIAELQEAAYENKNSVKIDIQKTEDKELVLSFARSFKQLSNGDVNEIQTILKRAMGRN